MTWQMGKTRRITCSVSLFEVILFIYQNAADPAHLHNTAPPPYVNESLRQY